MGIIHDVLGLHRRVQSNLLNYDVTYANFSWEKFSRAEWDTPLYFYGVIPCFGGLGQFDFNTGIKSIFLVWSPPLSTAISQLSTYWF